MYLIQKDSYMEEETTLPLKLKLLKIINTYFKQMMVRNIQ